jgi:hypothetical protein
MFNKMLTHFTNINLLNNLAKPIIFLGFILKKNQQPISSGCNFL